MWFSAINELLMFFFGMASLWCWRRASDEGAIRLVEGTGGSGLVCARAAFQGIRHLPAAAVRAGAGTRAVARAGCLDWRRIWRWRCWAWRRSRRAAPTRSASRTAAFRCTRRSGSPGRTALRACCGSGDGRLLLVLVVFGDARFRRGALLALAWIGIALVPYSFLTYSTQIPSRQVYLASAGLALLVGLALAQVSGTPDRRRWSSLSCCCTTRVYLWTKKRAQFVERAAPTEQLIHFARRTPGAIWVQCFPLAAITAEAGGAAGHGPLAVGSGVECGRGAGTRGRGVLLSRISD